MKAGWTISTGIRNCSRKAERIAPETGFLEGRFTRPFCAHESDGGEDDARDHVPAGKRKAEYAKGCLRAGRAVDRVQIRQQAAGIGGDARAAAAACRAFPEGPFDARVIDAHAGADQHHHADDDQQSAGDPGGQADRRNDDRQNADRNAVIIGIALQQAERAGDIAADILEGERPADRRRHAEGEDDGIADTGAGTGCGSCQRHALLLKCFDRPGRHGLT